MALFRPLLITGSLGPLCSLCWLDCVELRGTRKPRFAFGRFESIGNAETMAFLMFPFHTPVDRFASFRPVNCKPFASSGELQAESMDSMSHRWNFRSNPLQPNSQLRKHVSANSEL